MSHFWIVVTSATAARVYNKVEGEPALQLAREFYNSAAETGPAGDATAAADDPRQYSAQRFARDLSGMLELGAAHQLYSRIVIAASRDFLEVLRSAIGPATRQRLICIVDSDFSRPRVHDLDGEMGQLLNMATSAKEAAHN